MTTNASLDAADTYALGESNTRIRRGFRARHVTGIARCVALALAAEVGSRWHVGLLAVVLAIWLASRRYPLYSRSLLDRVVPIFWVWTAIIMISGWVGPFLPWIHRPWFMVAVLWPLLARERRPRSGQIAGPIQLMSWAAGLLPALLLLSPVLFAGLPRVLTLLGAGWDNAYHVLMLQGVMSSSGYPAVAAGANVGPLPSGFLSYPLGPHQLWSLLLETGGVEPFDPRMIVGGYVAVSAFSYAAAGLTTVWAVGRVAPWLPRKPRAYIAALAVVTLGYVIAPMPALWATGFFNFVFAAAALLLVLWRVPGDSAAFNIIPGCVAVTVVAYSYPLLLPIPIGLLGIDLVRLLQRVGFRRVLDALPLLIVLALTTWPTVLPYLSGQTNGVAAVTTDGGMLAAPWWMLVGIAAVLGVAVVVSRPLRVTLRAGASLLVVSYVWVTFVCGFLVVRTGTLLYYGEKAIYALIVVELPFVAAGVSAVLLAAGRSRRAATGVLALLGVAALFAFAASQWLDANVKRDPGGFVKPAPGLTYLARGFDPDWFQWVDGQRVTETASAASVYSGSLPIAGDAFMRGSWMPQTHRLMDARWLLALSGPHDVPSALWLDDLLGYARDLSAASTFLAKWLTGNSAATVTVVVSTEGARTAWLAEIPSGVMDRVRVVVDPALTPPRIVEMVP